MNTSLHHLDLRSPLGRLRLIARGDAIAAILLPEQARPESRADGKRPILREAAEQLEAYFAGTRRGFDLVLDPGGT
ncbi:MAG: cysteine methyltransferase, partial [Myxococcales bacterium]|nr:cysteine methyltransferase [Myxococcales bacterium]